MKAYRRRSERRATSNLNDRAKKRIIQLRREKIMDVHIEGYYQLTELLTSISNSLKEIALILEEIKGKM